jgi:hypothetical protein
VIVTDQCPELAELAGWTEDDMSVWAGDAETAWRDDQLDAQRECDQARERGEYADQRAHDVAWMTASGRAAVECAS